MPLTFTADDIQSVTIEYRSELPSTCGCPNAPLYLPDVRITMIVGFDSSEGMVHFDLHEIGDDEHFDCDIGTGNGDVWGLRDTQNAIAAAIDEFYRRGFDKQFPLIGE